MITVETRRGIVEAILRADREVADGMVFMPFCFNESPANALTNPMLDPYGKIPEFKYCAARVAKREEILAGQGHQRPSFWPFQSQFARRSVPPARRSWPRATLDSDRFGATDIRVSSRHLQASARRRTPRGASC